MPSSDDTTPPTSGIRLTATEAAFYRRMDNQDKVLDEIKGALIGNPKMGHVGLVDRISQSEEFRSHHTKLHEQMDRQLIKWGGIVTGLGLALSLLKDQLIDLLFRKG